MIHLGKENNVKIQCLVRVSGCVLGCPVTVQIFALEKQDGIGSSWEVVIQTFLRMTATSCLPIPFATAIIYLMTVPLKLWNAFVYVQLTCLSLMLNMVWTAFAEFVICIEPNFGFKLAPIITSVTGFVGGFLIPRPDMKCWWVELSQCFYF